MNRGKIISSRTVYNLFDYISDMGGIYGSIVLLGTSFSALFGSKLAVIRRAEGLSYRVTATDSSGNERSATGNEDRLSWFNNLSQFRLTFCQKFLFVLFNCLFCIRVSSSKGLSCCKNQKRIKRMLESSEGRLQKAFDVEELLRMQDSMKTVLNLLLPSERDQRLLRL